VVRSFFFLQISRTNPSPNHFFVPFVSVCFCFGLSFCFGVVRGLQCSTSPIRGRLRKNSLSCPCYLCLARLTSKCFSCFALLMQAVRSNPAESPFRTRFGRSGLLFFAVCPSVYLHECLCLSLAHPPPPCPMFRNVSLCFLLSLTTRPLF
jgi:hypothetical protein